MPNQDPSLIQLPNALVDLQSEPVRQSRWRTLWVWLLLGLNGFIILGTLIVDLANPVEPPKAVGLEKLHEDNRRAKAKWSDGSKASLLESDYRQTSRVRKTLSKPYTEFLFRMLGEAGQKLIVGRDGVLFLRERVASPRVPMRRGAKRHAAIQAALSRRLQAIGIQLVTVPIPRRAVVCEDWLPDGWDPNPGLDEGVLEEFQNRGLTTVDLLPTLRAHAELAFLRYDTHWSTIGIKESAFAIIEELGLLAPESQRLGTIRQVPALTTAPLGDLTLLSGIEFKDSDAERYQRDILQVLMDNNQAIDTNDQGSNIVVCGTSFSAHGYFAAFLSHFAGRPIQNFSIPGSPPEVCMLTMLRQRKSASFPQIVIEEIPNHFIVLNDIDDHRWGVFPQVSDLFHEFRPARFVAIPFQAQNLQMPSPFGTDLHAVGGRELARLDAGHIAHTGGGVVELKITGRLTSGDIRISCYSGRSHISMPWDATAGLTQIPLLLEDPGADGIRLNMDTVTPEANFTLDNIELRVLATPESGIHFTRSDANSDNAQSLHCPQGTVVPRHGTLVLQTAVERPHVADVVVTVEALDPTLTRPFEFGKLAPGAPIFLDLGYLTGREIRSIQVRSSTPSPTELIESAVLYPIP